MVLRKIVADAGKVWKHKITGDILSDELYLGVDDSIDNYEQVDEPKEVADDEQRATTSE